MGAKGCLALLVALPVVQVHLYTILRWPFSPYYLKGPMKNAFTYTSVYRWPYQTQIGYRMASTYTNVLFQPQSEQYQPRFFPRYKACSGTKGLQLNRYFDDFDASKNGLVSFREVQQISLCDFDRLTEPNCAPFVDVASTSFDVLRKIVPTLLFQFFSQTDRDENQNLDMEEFSAFAQLLADANDFYEKALLDESGDDEVISQSEWICTKDQIVNGNCDLSSGDFTLIENMIGNNGDSELTFNEFRNVMEFYEGVARQSGKLDEFCSSSTDEGKALFTLGDGTWGDWSDWSCPKPCLTNPVQQQTRTRDCTGSGYSPPRCPGLAEQSNGVKCTQDACCGGEVVQAGRASYCYRTSGGTRDEAKGVCADMGVGVMLPEPTSATEMNELKTAVEGIRDQTGDGVWWLGFDIDPRSRNLLLSDGTQASYANWAEGERQPNQDGSCVYAISSGDTLNDDSVKISGPNDPSYFHWFDTDCNGQDKARNTICRFP